MGEWASIALTHFGRWEVLEVQKIGHKISGNRLSVILDRNLATKGTISFILRGNRYPTHFSWQCRSFRPMFVETKPNEEITRSFLRRKIDP